MAWRSAGHRQEDVHTFTLTFTHIQSECSLQHMCIPAIASEFVQLQAYDAHTMRIDKEVRTTH